MLSTTWQSQNSNDKKRRTLFRDLSRIIISLAQVPFQRELVH